MVKFCIVNKCIGFFANHNSGKSFLFRYLLTNEKHSLDKVFCIFPTENVNRFYSELFPEDCIFDKYDDEWVGQPIARLMEQYKKIIRRRKYF